MFECRTSKAIFQSKTWKNDFSKTVLKLKFSLMLILMSGFDFSCRSQKGKLSLEKELVLCEKYPSASSTQ